MRISIILILLIISLKSYPQTGTFIDIRDGKEYSYSKIGSQIWMTQNLDYYAEGKSWKYPEKDSLSCGRYYTWEVAQDVCPEGWSLPSYEDWTIMTDYIGTDSIAVFKLSGLLVSKETLNFNICLSGYRFYFDKFFYGYSDFAYFWTSTKYSGRLAYSVYLEQKDKLLIKTFDVKDNGLSVRCIKENPDFIIDP